MGFPASKMRLFYIDAELREVVGREEMRFPQKQLYSYNMQDGDEIHVEKKPVPISTLSSSSSARSSSAMSSSI